MIAPSDSDELEPWRNMIRQLFDTINALERRIIDLELQLDSHRDPNPPDGYYFDY